MFNLTELFSKPITKDDILSVLDNTESKITTIVIPTYKNAVPALKDVKLNEEAEYILSILARNYSNGSNDLSKTVSAIYKDLTKIRGVITDLEEAIDSNLPDAVVKDNVTLKSEALMKLASQIEFTVDYSIYLLDYFVTESSEYENLEVEIPKPIVSYIKANVLAFGQMLDFLTENAKQIINNLDNVPDVRVVGLDKSMIKAAISKLKYMMRLSNLEKGFVGNPIYHIRMWIAEIQVYKYQGDKDRKRLLELKIAKLKENKNGKNNAKIDKQVEYYQNLVNDIDFKIKQYEKELDE